MERRSKCIVFVTALAWLSFATLAYALDDKVFPGTSCQPEEAAIDAPIINTYASHVLNVGDNYLFVNCPIVRDNTINTNGTNSVSVRVQSSGGAELTCGLVSYTQFGGIKESRTKSTFSNSPTNLSLDVNMGTNGGFYSLQCFLPPGAKLYSYKVSEF